LATIFGAMDGAGRMLGQGAGMNWARILAYVAGTVDQELLLRNEYLAAENRILTAQLKGRLRLSDAERATCARVRRLLLRRDGPTLCVRHHLKRADQAGAKHPRFV
jgi:hypothetical protein